MSNEREVMLRSERDGEDWRLLSAYVDASGNLHIDGHDLGPGTAPVSSDGEYEWFQTVRAADVPRLIEVLGGKPGDDVLDLLGSAYRGKRSYELEEILRSGAVPVELSVYSG